MSSSTQLLRSQREIVHLTLNGKKTVCGFQVTRTWWPTTEMEPFCIRCEQKIGGKDGLKRILEAS